MLMCTTGVVSIVFHIHGLIHCCPSFVPLYFNWAEHLGGKKKYFVYKPLYKCCCLGNHGIVCYF